MSVQVTQSPFVQCTDCSFIASTQGHLGIHRSKMHHAAVSDHVKSVNIVRLFPEGKSFYCCLCNNIIGSFPNFKRHYGNKHKGISLNISAKCTICNRIFQENRGTGVHLQRSHQIGKNDPYPLSPTPVMSYVDLEVSENKNTITPSRRSHRSRAKLLAEASLSMSRNVSSQISSPLSTIINDTNHDVRLRVPSYLIPLLLHQQHPKTPSLSPLHSQIPSFPHQPLTNPNRITVIT